MEINAAPAADENRLQSMIAFVAGFPFLDKRCGMMYRTEPNERLTIVQAEGESANLHVCAVNKIALI